MNQRGIFIGSLNTAIGYKSEISNNLSNATAIGAKRLLQHLTPYN